MLGLRLWICQCTSSRLLMAAVWLVPSLVLFNAVLTAERQWRGPKTLWVWGWDGTEKERGELYLPLHCHHQNVYTVTTRMYTLSPPE